MNQWFYPRGTLRQGVWDTVVDSSIPGWKHTGMRIGDVKDSPRFTILPDLIERVIYMLHGSTTTVKYVLDGSSTEETVVLKGRQSVFHGAVDYLYLPINTAIEFETDGRVMVVEAPATNAKPVQLRKATDVPLLLRGAGRSTRQIHDFGGEEHLDADRMIAVEVIAPAGNWSGIPPHKHDTYDPGVESNLKKSITSSWRRIVRITRKVPPIRWPISAPIHRTSGNLMKFSKFETAMWCWCLLVITDLPQRCPAMTCIS